MCETDLVARKDGVLKHEAGVANSGTGLKRFCVFELYELYSESKAIWNY